MNSWLTELDGLRSAILTTDRIRRTLHDRIAENICLDMIQYLSNRRIGLLTAMSDEEIDEIHRTSTISSVRHWWFLPDEIASRVERLERQVRSLTASLGREIRKNRKSNYHRIRYATRHTSIRSRSMKGREFDD